MLQNNASSRKAFAKKQPSKEMVVAEDEFYDDEDDIVEVDDGILPKKIRDKEFTTFFCKHVSILKLGFLKNDFLHINFNKNHFF